MPKINVLEKSVAELIAAGEVVERPASVVKELIENSIDAKAKHITIELRRGGISLLRITDDGCGIERADVPKAFLRHATSKIKNADDLDAIATLGFRGEALAATSSVSKIEMITKSSDEEMGTHYMIEGGVEVLNEETGCPDGTTIIVTDLFYNTPARMKFLKKDVSEGNAVAAVVDRVALSHPEISFKLIREGKQTLSTAGDGKLESAVYTVLGRDFARSVISVVGENNGITVNGLICKPISCRNSRSWQFVFLNGRFVQSGTVTAAVEQAYKNSTMVGKFPAFVINVSVPYGTVDVNVHPAKTQVRFSDERRVFEAVYTAVKAALSHSDTRPTIPTSNSTSSLSPFAHISTKEYRQQIFNTEVETSEKKDKTEVKMQPAVKNEPSKFSRLNDSSPVFFDDALDYVKSKSVDIVREPDDIKNPTPLNNDEQINESIKKESESAENTKVQIIKKEPLVESDPIKLIGEAFSTYIIVEKGNSIFLIDKHAAHERILFEKLKAEQNIDIQELLYPVKVTLGKAEYDACISETSLLLKAGFEIEDFGNATVLVRSVPSALMNCDITAIVEEAAAGLVRFGQVQNDRLDDIYHSIACKAATKGGYHTTDAEMLTLAKRVLNNNDIMYCPHGRPVAFELKRRDLEKQFGRIQ
ncbi:MAG: DNA mismatch repair endonuclease MutL [Ruminococcaceae bacterium]|nr:DNA mismatch repair endonuclease MutL [Oscillospiraceae bacterium]